MKLHGSAALDAPREAVFAAICDPGALLEVIPGCEEIRQVSADEYRGRIAIRVPGIAGTYDTVVRLVQANPPASLELEGRVEGRVGTIEGRARIRLSDAGGGTVIAYEGAGTIGGPLARLDSRFTESLATSLIAEGLSRLGKSLRAAPAAAAR